MRAPVVAGVARKRVVAPVVALALLVPGLLAQHVGAATPQPPTSPPGTPAASAPPAVPSQPPPVLPPAPVSGATAAGVARALAGPLAARRLGTAVAATVLAADGTTLLDRAGTTPHTPASTTKMLTAVAALEVLGPQTRLSTRVVTDEPAGAGTPGPTGTSGPLDVVLVGAGDASLRSGAADTRAHPSGDATSYARLDVLADRVAKAAAGRPVSVHVDDSLFAAPAISPDWGKGYVPSGEAAPVMALSVDQGRVRVGAPARVADPALAAGRALAAQLRTRHVATVGTVTRTRATPSARALAQVQSPPVRDLVERMLTQSDNDLAEALGRLVAHAAGQAANSAGAGAAVVSAVGALGVPVTGAHLLDTSGLARGSRIPPTTLVRTLLTAASPQHPELRSLLTGLPVAGATGTLAGRYPRGGPAAAARGEVRAKTGTLTGVSALAGVAQGRDGGLVVFAFMADAVPATGTLEARAALDAAAAALAACGCAG
ncbi:D-alanyl-D-alanine carboxypeptidase/D-alanyl-D-alanine-endopeptidase (penicillin-binding protein 4) [Motilibacter peucedani]|uniref:D-alanyl-D-alanine carboxypeptidase/D-alanyl-D-alanine-endopeptidase (Penicillin-binding protein 4) n=1 Tax=Motilibacter peucedani TaxID=598650 RepID=A0A420XPX5_9ACTN|nr:D-alanyl-D-alanine carboxypeptidase/D-alanyl-D-alanine-endopeptidase [Motilibacter peucedani]RKS75286.1 D-alanyl-D-alanine carboxypeptidase/D-alanyl-D-alanine-endopeptidase (penicillin-binding protein 4) [Motilibacter peucedani]